MKSKFSKILGVGLTIAVLASLLVVGTPVSAGDRAYSTFTTPSKSGEVLQGSSVTLDGSTNVDFLVAAADGTTMFAYSNPFNQTTLATTAIAAGDNVTVITVASTAGFVDGVTTIYVGSESFTTTNKTGTTFNIQASKTNTSIGKLASEAHLVGAPVGDGIPLLYKSTNAGVKWSSSSIGAGLEAFKIVDLAISPRYATDAAVVAATTTQVLYSADGGATFNSVAPDSLATKLEGGTVTSVDIGNYWKTGVLSLLIGVTGGAAAFSNVLRFDLNQYSWSEIGPAGGNVTAESVLAVAFSPTHQADAEFLAVTTNGTHTNLNTHFALDTTAWDAAPRPPRVKLTTSTTADNTGSFVATAAVIAFGSDFSGLTTNTVLVGTQDAGGTGGVIRVASLGDATVKTRNLLTGNIKSLAISGAIATGNVLVGTVGSSTIQRTSAVTASSVTWADSTKKNPTGTDPQVLWGAGTNAYAGTTGTGSAFSRSTDGGVTFNQLSLVDVKDISKISIQDSAVVDANNVFVILNNSSGGGYAARSLWVTTDGGKTYQQILTGATLEIVAPSANFSTDKTLYVTDTTSTVRKSVDGGNSFTTEFVPVTTALTAIALADKDTYFVGSASGEFYKKGLFVSATGLAGKVMSIVLSPDYATDKTILVGNDAGSVYISTDGGVTFASVGATGSLGAGATVYVVPDPAFAKNKTIYAVGTADATKGVMRTQSTSTTATWTTLDTNNATLLGGGIVVSPRGTLYVASNVADKGIRRTLTPLIKLSVPQTAEEMADLAVAFDSMTGGTIKETGLLPASGKLTDLQLISGNVLYVVEKGGSDTPFGEAKAVFGYKDRLLTITDTLAPTSATVTGAPAPSSPAFTKTAIPALSTPYKATLSWKAVTGATAYEVMYSDASSFSTTDAAVTTVTAGGLTTTTLNIGSTTETGAGALKSGKQYYWKVRVTAPDPSPFSATWSFYTALPDVPVVAVAASPEMGKVDASVTPTFTWPVVKGATNYEFMIGTDSTFAIIDLSANTGSLNAYTINPKEPLLYSTVYFWRVRGTTALPVSTKAPAQGGAWSVFTFTTMAKPVPVAKAEPAVIVQPGKTEIQVVQVPVEKVVPQPIPSYLLWTIILIGAVLIVALIILIVRTRRVS